MAKMIEPRADSAAHKGICRLVDLGGTATASQLMGVLSAEFRSYTRFQIRVSDVLEQCRFAVVEKGKFTATQAGKDYVANILERDLPVAAKYVGQIVPPRTPRPHRPLNVSKHMATLPMREGAFDYRQIPSVMAGKRILPGGGIIE